MNLDTLPLPWNNETISYLKEITAFNTETQFCKFLHLDIELDDGFTLRPIGIQDSIYIQCLSQTFAVRKQNYAGVYQCDTRIGFFFATRMPIQGNVLDDATSSRRIAAAYQYRQDTNGEGEFWLLSIQTWYWVRQALPERLQMVMQSLNDLPRFEVTFEPGKDGEAKDVRIEWINR